MVREKKTEGSNPEDKTVNSLGRKQQVYGPVCWWCCALLRGDLAKMTRFIGVRMGVALRKPILVEWHKEETGEQKGDSQCKDSSKWSRRLGLRWRRIQVYEMSEARWLTVCVWTAQRGSVGEETPGADESGQSEGMKWLEWREGMSSSYSGCSVGPLTHCPSHFKNTLKT